MIMRNILVTGGNGQLGMELKSLLNYDTDFNFIFTSSKELDITDHKRVKEYVMKEEIDMIINCAAYTSVDKAEKEQILADAINHLAVANLAQVAKDNNVNLIHISTDYVFDGLKNSPYVESDDTNPQTVYGKTKLKGELAIKNISPNDSMIIRTSWLFSRFGNNFVNRIIELSKTNKKINVISDQIGSPTNAKDLARAILKILPKIKNSNVELFHFSNKGSCSWYEFAKKTFKINNIKTLLIPVHSDNYKSTVNRPNYSVLSTSKIENKYKFDIPYWVDALKENFNIINE
tara:strand:+ start:1044 stop:1913 length:870 start_codon:yes stop_codon:yes gene_type:complete